MSITEIIKNQDFFKNIIEKHEKGLLLNALLFFCEDQETSKATLVLTALMLEYNVFELFNENSAEYQRILSGVDLDIKVYPKNGEKLLVADSNEIVSEAYIKPVNLKNKIFIINNFDVSTDEAQNKLLKVLEEPPKNVFFLISAKSEERVLATIKSRCEKIKIYPMDLQELQNVSQNRLAVILGGGFIGKTLMLEKNENLNAYADFIVSVFTKLKSSKEVIKYSKQFLEYKNNLKLLLQIFTLCIEDILKIKCESENLCSLNPYIVDLKDVEPEFSVEALCEISKLVCTLQEKIEFNANLNIVIDNFLLKMLEVKFLCK